MSIYKHPCCFPSLRLIRLLYQLSFNIISTPISSSIPLQYASMQTLRSTSWRISVQLIVSFHFWWWPAAGCGLEVFLKVPQIWGATYLYVQWLICTGHVSCNPFCMTLSPYHKPSTTLQDWSKGQMRFCLGPEYTVEHDLYNKSPEWLAINPRRLCHGLIPRSV